MAPGLQRFEYNSAGFIKIMKSPDVQAVLRAKAEQVRRAVEARYADRPPGWTIVTDVQVGRTRARAIVSGVPESEEMAERIMASALDAAR